MKTRIFQALLPAAFALATSLPTAQAADGTTVIERGAHHRVLQITQSTTNPLTGAVSVQTNYYTELASGMHYWKDSQWRETEEAIKPHPKGAAALNGPHQVIFAPNLNEAGAVNVTMPDGRELRSHVMCVALFDRATGKIATIGTIKDNEGWILPPNQMVYFDCFAGVKADIRFTYTRQGLEQDIVLREQLPDPGNLLPGALPQNVEVQIVTEFLNAPEPQVKSRIITREAEAARRPALAYPDWTDQSIKLGSMHFGRGQAFAWPQPNDRQPTCKTWETVDNRRFLVESVPYAKLAAALQALPRPGAGVRKPNEVRNLAALVPPPERLAVDKQLSLASTDQRRGFNAPGYVLDYTQVITVTNFTFDGGTEYIASGPVYLSGTIIFEPGTIIRYARTNNPSLIFENNAQPVFQGRPYEPVFLTSADDTSIGLCSSTNTPALNFTALDFTDAGADLDIKYLRITYAAGGVVFGYGSNQTISHCQLVNCANGMFARSNVVANNLLFHNVGVVLDGEGYDVRGSHWTVNDCDYSVTYGDAPTALYLTNSLIANFASLGSVFNPANNSMVQTSGVTFTTAIAGYNYQPTNSAYRNAGNTNLPAGLLADLQRKTVTAPQVIYSNALIATDLTLGPTVDLDSGVPDLGYHYDPVDYLTYNLQVSNCTLTVTGGVAIAAHGATAIWLNGGSKLNSLGSALKPNTFTIVAGVQEQPLLWGGSPLNGFMFFNPGHSSGANPQITLRYNNVRAFKQYIGYSKSSSMWRVDVYDAQHCSFSQGKFYLGTSTTSNYFINCLFEKNYLGIQESASAVLRNCLFYYGSFDLSTDSANPVYAFDNIFHQSVNDTVIDVVNSNNCYVGSIARLTPNSAGDVILTNLTYVSGALGNYYLSTNQANLIDKGSATAASAGLYHFTTTINQVKEAGSTVDIGLHYVALDAFGQPVDSDGDGVPDYLEDLNGNGVVDAGETDWTDPNDWGIRVFITQPRGN